MDAKDLKIQRLTDENSVLKDLLVKTQEQIKRLEDRIARLEKNSDNSSKPPSSDIVKPKREIKKTSRKKRKRGGQPGHRKYCRPTFKPDEIDKTIEYEFRETDATGLVALDDWLVVQQITLPTKMYRITEHRARKYLDLLTGKIHVAPLPPEIQRGNLLGTDFSVLIAFMKGGCHMSYSTIQQFCKEVMQLPLSRGLLSKATQKVSQALKPMYDSIIENLPYEAYLGVDETGHKNNGKKHWTWCFQTSHYSLFHIDKSRGSQVLFKLLGEEFNGILNCDYYGCYRKFSRLTNATVQYCMAHLIREIRFLADHSSTSLSRWGHKLLTWIRKLFQTLHRYETMTAAGFARIYEVY